MAASRLARGPAPRFTDADLGRPGGEPAPPPVRSGRPGADRNLEPEPEPEDREARASELRERLLDLEAALAAIGASGLPVAPRNPNRFLSGLDAARLRAERDEVRRELEALAGQAISNSTPNRSP